MRYLDVPGVSPSSPPDLGLRYAESLGVTWDAVGVDVATLRPGDTIVTGPWGQWGWLPRWLHIEVIPDHTKPKREDPLLWYLHAHDIPVGLRTKPPGPRSKWYPAWQECQQWLSTVVASLPEPTGNLSITGSYAPYSVVTDPHEAVDVIRGLHGRPYAWDFETNGLDPRGITRVGVALADANHSWWITDVAFTEPTLRALAELLLDPASEQRGSNLKFDAKVMWGQTRQWVKPVWPLMLSPIYDTQIMAWILQAGTQYTYSNDLKSLAKRYLGREVLALDDVGGPEEFWNQSYDTQAIYAAAGDARNSYDLVDYLRTALREHDLWDVYIQIDQPIIPVLAEMEIEGLRIDRKRLLEITKDFTVWSNDVVSELQSLGFRGSMTNDNHIAKFLYDELGLPILVRTEKTDRGSVAIPVLQRLYLMRDTDPVVAANARAVELTLEFAEVDKGLSTFCIPPLSRPGDMLYERFAQTSTVTGRLAGPTMQVPGHGRRAVLREVYVAPDGCELHDSDYAQIEPRLGAHHSKDERMLRDFREGRDVYMSLGADMGMDITDKHDPRRQNLKTVYLADMYIVRPPQIQTIALRQGTYIPLALAAEYQAGIHRARPGFFEWRDALIADARYHRAVRNMSGRRRVANDLNAIDPGSRAAAERETSNFPEQSGAGDILKLAMPGLQRLARSAGGSLVNAVHDELVDYTRELSVSQRTEYLAETARIMTGVVDLDVPLLVESGYGRTWKDAKA